MTVETSGETAKRVEIELRGVGIVASGTMTYQQLVDELVRIAEEHDLVSFRVFVQSHEGVTEVLDKEHLRQLWPSLPDAVRFIIVRAEFGG